MSAELVQAMHANLFSPAVLFFALGIFATVTRSDLKFPEPLYLGLTIYLLTSIGFKGGVSIAKVGLGAVWLPCLGAVFLGTAICLWCFFILKSLCRLKVVDAAALAAHYGSCSAVTFIAATNFLKSVSLPYEEYAAAFLAVMESPAIVSAIVLGKLATRTQGDALWPSLKTALHEAVLGRSVILLVGALLIGLLSGERGYEATAGFFVAPFQGVLSLFLLEMGMVAARRFDDLKKVGLVLVGFGIVMPIINAAAGIGIGHACGLSLGGAMLMGVLAASASYIAAPAAVRLSIPEANPSLYLTSALAITFPFNITLGVPLYLEMARVICGDAS